MKGEISTPGVTGMKFLEASTPFHYGKFYIMAKLKKKFT